MVRATCNFTHTYQNDTKQTTFYEYRYNFPVSNEASSHLYSCMLISVAAAISTIVSRPGKALKSILPRTAHVVTRRSLTDMHKDM